MIKESEKVGDGVELDTGEAIHKGFCAFKFEWYGKGRPTHNACLSYPHLDTFTLAMLGS